jgi:hypothetical protein
MKLGAYIRFLSFVLVISIASCTTTKHPLQFDEETAKEALQFASKQYEGMMKIVPDTKLPRTTHKDGKLGLVNAPDWTSGFYPGILWYLYEFNQNKAFKTKAIKYTNLLENQKNNSSTHDLGFMLYCSYGNGFRITNDSIYKQVLLTGAKTLSGRFNEKIGCIKSWDWNPKWQFPVIVDNMMNLEYLFWASKNTKDSTFYKQAVSHADITLKNHFRKDNSSVHMIDYDTITGTIIEKITVQGFSNESAWARGQAWGLYGYTMMYRETFDLKYVEQANKIATYIFNHPNMPIDLIPYWDFNAETIPNIPRDTSAAAIIASALLELSQYVDANLKKEYIAKATTILQHLSNAPYRAELGKNNNFILKHATGHLPGNKEIDVPLIYADYYYIEALLRYIKLNPQN